MGNHSSRFGNLVSWQFGNLITKLPSYQVTKCVLAVLVGVAAVHGQQAGDRARTEASARRATERLQALQREADQLASDERTLLNDLRTLEVERQIRTEDVKRIAGEADEIGAELATNTEQIGALERQDLAERPDLRARLVEIYKLGRARYLRLLLSTSDVHQIGRASRLTAALARFDRERVVAHQQTLTELQRARRQLEDRNRTLRALRADAERAERAAAAAANKRADLVRDIDRRRDLNAQLAGELQAAQQKLQLALRDVASGVPVADPTPLPVRSFRGALDWPVAGQVRRRFGRGAGPRAVESKGVEIAANEGAGVQAVHEGTVAFADPFPGFGNLVILDHGGQIFSLYGDLLDTTVKKGARIERGQPIGSVGTSPTGAAGLYFEIRVDGQAVDPLEWLRKR